MSRPVRQIFIDATPLSSPRLTGVGRVLMGLLRALDTQEVAEQVDIVLLVPRAEAPTLDRYAFQRLRIRAIPLPGRVWSALTRLPQPLGIDLVLGRGTYFFPNFRNWPLARSRSLTFVHDVCFAVLPELVPTARRELLARSVPRWLARTDLVLTGTPSSAAEITRFLDIPAERIRVIPTTIDNPPFSPQSEAEIAAVREQYRLGRYLLFVGSIEKRKNLVTLIDAYRRARRPPDHTLFLVGGDGWDNEDVHTAVARAVAEGIDVRFPPRYLADDDLPALLSGADAVAMPSWHEGFGLPALEAVACGTPVLAADIPGLRDALVGWEDETCFIPPADLAGWTSAIEETLRNPRTIVPRPIANWSTSARLLLTLALAGQPAASSEQF
ncbi:glycosyltransferase family 4 protein [Rathayibacter toxicus]|uniref:glycosyltransferase family 4 protein n=1 Tax=Rathayibacter toxicus TaxID=145458 RepID=UPI001C03ED34|nr:glycosyltransferase family 1 protein [Rathayibacter toxicus]QWL31847.1 glycosyltransferase family 1 protein [Rathayibacter toxicus]QWL33940.1 glycosyltransferase family 1 protein [Rathayibacter toxicus]QWL36072.1 glycosyltransferase family 1 protein [Rathayibacter toxicus]QWL38163.1 glycosyltransferase family 1 protein [Rathayibacter toxicus]QWL40252.1 glycosyltransferase family 1 protein [Rathayibacter toxicus]